MQQERSTLTPLFMPASVAIIGASQNPEKLGYHTLQNLRSCGYEGRIFPVNPNAEINGTRIYSSIRDIDEPVDCAFLAVPASRVIESLGECAESGVRSAVIGASGFAESGSKEAVAAQARVREIAHGSGMRVLGPNTNGLINTSGRLYLGFNAEHGRVQEPGTISIVSHSGALLGGIAATMRTVGGGLAKFTAVGNEADIGMLDVLDYLVDDPQTAVIGLVIESISDGDRFIEVARRAHGLGKRIVALKIGRSSAGVHAALAHSSRLSGAARAYDALLAACAISSVRSVEALTGACATLASTARPDAASPLDARPDRRLICVSTSGAGGALLADFSEDHGIPLACGGSGTWEDRLRDELGRMPSSAPIAHPLDVGILGGDWSRADAVLQVLERNGRDGPVVAYVHNGPTGKRDTDLLGALSVRRTRSRAPVLMVAPGGLAPRLEQLYRNAGIPVFRDLQSCFASLAAYRATAGDFAIAAAPAQRALQQNPGMLTAGRVGRGAFLSELESSKVLHEAGIPMVPSTVVRSAEHAAQVFASLSTRAVLKGLPEGVAHKNDAGMVFVGLNSAEAVAGAYGALQERLRRGGFPADSVCIVQPMVASKAELIVGVAHEAGLGHFLVVGFGGVHAEVIADVLLIPVRMVPAAMTRLLEPSRVGRLLARLDAGGMAREGLHAMLCALARFIESHAQAIDSVDLNPVMLTETGCVAVDALICLDTTPD